MTKSRLPAFSKLGAIIVILNDGAPEYLRSMLDCKILARESSKAIDQGMTLAGGSIDRAEEILEGLKSHLAEITGSES